VLLKREPQATTRRWNDAIQYKYSTLNPKYLSPQLYTITVYSDGFLPPIGWAETRELDNFLHAIISK
jgi:hypothetical protein